MVEINYFYNVDAKEHEALMTQVIEHTLKKENKTGSINIIIMNNEEIKTYNSQYRDKDYATDVLSFVDGEYDHLGDIMISIEKAEEQAKDYGHSLKRELAFLTVHGTLHLCGYDHLTNEDEKVMFNKQDEILNDLDIRR